MEKINNPDQVAAILAAAVVQKLDYGKESGESDAIANSTVACFKDIYRSICNFNSEIVQKLK